MKSCLLPADGFPMVIMQSGQVGIGSMAGMSLALLGGMGGGMGLPPHLMEEEPLFLDSSSRRGRQGGKLLCYFLVLNVIVCVLSTMGRETTWFCAPASYGLSVKITHLLVVQNGSLCGVAMLRITLQCIISLIVVVIGVIICLECYEPCTSCCRER